MSDIEVKKLSKRFKVNKKKEGLLGSVIGLFKREYLIVDAVKDISFEIRQGECIGLIGPNGAGKTTTLKMLTGLIFPTDGQVDVLGYVPWERKNDFRKQISLVMGNKFQLWWDLPACDGLDLHRIIYEIPYYEYKERLKKLAGVLQVENLLQVPLRNLSLGERMKMELIASLIHSPKIIFLDEPTIGLDYQSQKNIRQFLKEINLEHKTTIILTSHYMADIESICDRLLMIDKGKIIYDGLKEELVQLFDKEINVYLKLNNGFKADQLAMYGKVLFSDEKECDLLIDRKKYLEIIHHLLNSGMVKDFSMKPLSLEQIVEKHYQLEKNHAQ